MSSFVVPIPHGRLLQNHVIGIIGDVESNPSKSIVIGIQDTEGVLASSNILFQMTIDFKQRKIIRNSYQQGQWGIHDEFGAFPFIPGKHFELSIEMKKSTFMITVNKTHLFDYISPMPLRLAKFIFAEGQIKIDDITIGCELTRNYFEIRF